MLLCMVKKCMQKPMNYSKYYPVDVLNGEGTRCTLFVSGCTHTCKGCYNKATWSTKAGSEFTDALADQIITDLSDTRIPRQGLTLTGGDPLHPSNTKSVLALLQRVKRECPDKDIWMWSGYQLTEMNFTQSEILELVDVLIDGKYVAELASPKLAWRGSSNQVIHYL